MFDTGSDSSGRVRRLLRAATPATPPPPELAFCPAVTAGP